MKYADIKNYDIANGPGCRVSLFVSGCRNHCPGCFNQEAQSFKYGKDYTEFTVLDILNMLGNKHISGLSILGGDPFEPENQSGVNELCRRAKTCYPYKDIWVWTGYMWENVEDSPIMKYIDVLVDGPFIQEQKDLSLAYCGSRNQRVIDVKKSLEAGEVIQLEGELDLRILQKLCAD